MAEMLSQDSPPDLVLNRHCTECEFQNRCRKKAIEKDDLSLLARMNEKERKKFNDKGIFTVTQLSYTFRPRRRPKRLRDKREKYHHSLKALAIREKKIHTVGNPELKIEGTPVYLDVEGLPDREFYYLIGLRIDNSKSAVQHSLWADTEEDEGKIWGEFLGILETIKKPVLIHYGSYERTFIKRMSDRYGEPPDASVAAKALQSLHDLLSVVFASIYFPTHSNGLKDIADSIGYKWTDALFSGIESIARRSKWEHSHNDIAKSHLLRYNAHDCEALSRVTEAVHSLAAQQAISELHQSKDLNFVNTDLLKTQKKTKWGNFTSPVSSFEYVNSAAHWDYQKDRIYARTGKTPKNQRRVRRQRRKQKPIEKVIVWKTPNHCPNAGGKSV